MSNNAPKKIIKTDAEWRAALTPEQYAVTRGSGTEQAGTGPWLHEHRNGSFKCVCCGTELFRSETKFESGSGWPSFFAPVSREAIEDNEDQSHGMVRTEARCTTCEAHLGHVFPDGPKPTGMRFCMNGIALAFDPDK